MTLPTSTSKAGLLLFLSLALGCGEGGESPVVADELLEMDADHVVFEMNQNLTRDGVREGRVRADTAFFFQDSTAVHLRGVQLLVYTETGRERAEVISRTGRLDLATNAMVARGDVILTIREGGRRIETAELHYHPNQDQVSSDSATVMREGNQITEGTAFESDLDFRNVFIQNARTRTSGTGS